MTSVFTRPGKPTTFGRTPQPALDKILRHEPSGRGVLVCLIGLAGTGKSSLLAQFPNCEFIVDKRDQGILDLMDYSETTGVNLPRSSVTVCDNYLNYKGTLEAAIEGPSDTIVLESLVGIQSFCDDYTMSHDYDSASNPKAGNQFVNYRQGLILSANVHFQALIDLMIRGQNSGKNIFLTGHSKIGSGKSVTSEDWVSQVLENSPEIGRRVNASFATILHIGQSVATIKPAGKVRATGDIVYSIYTELNPYFPAKNRMGLHGEIEYPSSPQEAYLVLCKALKLDPNTGKRL